jgi:uncharacterized protein
MRILIDVGHPAHVHYIKYFIRKVQKEGHKVLVIARKRDFVFYLLNQYNIEYVSRGDGSDSFWGKIFKMLIIEYKIFKIANKFRPDLCFGPTSHYLAPISWLFRKPYIAFDDTECSTLSFMLSMPFISHILTPASFQKDLGKKQIKFDGYLKTCYLHRNYYKPNPKVLEYLKLNLDEKFIIFRFVAFKAYHDVGFTNLTEDQKRNLVNIFSKYAKIFISSESELSDDLKPYKIQIPAEMMHDALHYASLFIGQSDTMAAEAALVGTSSIDIQSKGEHKEGVIIDLEKYGILSVIDFSETQIDEIIKNGIDRITSDTKTRNLEMLELVYENSIDVTSFMMWFVLNYPESAMIMQNDHTFQNRFK